MATKPSFDQSESESESGSSDSSEYSQPIPIAIEKPEDTRTDSKSESESASQSESESESESDSEAAAEKFRVKPVSPPKPKVEKKHAPKSTPKPSENGSAAATLTKTPTVAKAKRPAEKERSEVEMPSKKHKNDNRGSSGVTEKSAKKTDPGRTDNKLPQQQSPFKRVWSDEDEIVILEGLFDYAEKKGVDPTTDKNGFYDFIKEILRTRYTRKQISDKVRRLKAKYQEAQRKNKDLTTPHEKKSFELFKKIWGSGKAAVRNAGINLHVENDQKGKTEKEASPSNCPNGETDEDDAADDGPMGKTDDEGASGKRGKDKGFLESLMVKSLAEVGMDEDVVRRGIALATEEKKEVMERKWREFAVEEMELIAKKFKLIQRSCQFVSASLKSGGK